MTDTIKQAISALMDEEASEIEVHRLLRHFENDPSTRETWIRYQQIRAVSQNETLLSSQQHLGLHERISGAIASEETFALSTPTNSRNWAKPAAGFAIAASLVVAVFVGINSNQALNPEMDAVATVPTATATPNIAAPIAAQPASTNDVLGQQVAFNEDDLELRELDEAKQQRLREYLLKHDRLSRMNNNTRTVNFQQPAGNK